MQILKNIAEVIISPRVGWEDINRSGISTKALLFKGYYPLLVILFASAFVPKLYDNTIDFYFLLIESIAQASIFFISYLVINFFLSGCYPEICKTRAGQARLNDYIIYNQIFLILLNIVGNVMPIEFTPVLFMMLYVMWIATKGVEMLELKKEKETKFILISSAMLLIAPILINFIKQTHNNF